MIAKLKIEPPVVKAYGDLYYGDFKRPASVKLIPASFKVSRPQPDILGWGHISDPLGKGIQQILLSPGPIEPTLKSTQDAMQSLLDQQWQSLNNH